MLVDAVALQTLLDEAELNQIDVETVVELCEVEGRPTELLEAADDEARDRARRA